MKHWILLLACFWASVLLAETEKEFLERVDRALNKETQMAHIDALGALYYRHGIDEQTARFVERVLGMLSERKGAQASLVEITDEEFRHVLNGYEYRPNLTPVGLLKIEGGEKGGHSTVPYALHENKYYLPATIRERLVENAPPDITLQMLVLGLGYPALKFSGWCDVRLSDGSVKRQAISDGGNGSMSLIFHGQVFERCELESLSRHGTLNFTLIEAENTVFKKSAEHPEKRLKYMR